jgi:trans-2,3-dihydro-3-hydroxyanthranilate isomerase
VTDDPAGRASAFGVDAVIANPGAPRLLLAVVDRATLATLRPDPAALATACRRHGLLGCFVHVTERRPSGYVGAARMFAPAIGVDEDVANANSTAGQPVALATARRSVCRLVLDQGDALGKPSTVHAESVPPSDEASGTVRAGGRAHVESSKSGGLL